MMIPDVDDMIICSKCGGRIFYENPVYSYDKHPKLKGTWVRVPKMIDLVCRKCGQKESCRCTWLPIIPAFMNGTAGSSCVRRRTTAGMRRGFISVDDTVSHCGSTVHHPGRPFSNKGSLSGENAILHHLDSGKQDMIYCIQ